MSASEKVCREFAAQFNTPNVRRAIALCESGVITWDEFERIARDSLAKGLAEVA